MIDQSFWKLREVYTNGYQLVVIGYPPELPEDDPLRHDCDQMGCGFDHVIARIPLGYPVPRLEWEKEIMP